MIMFKKFTSKSQFSRNILTLMTGTTIAQAIPIAISPILTRMYTPEEFGLFALYVAIASIFAVIVTGRYELAIMLPLKDGDAANVVLLSLLIAVFVSISLLIIIILFSMEISLMLEAEKIRPWLYLLPITTFVVGAYNSFNFWHNRKKRFINMSQSKVLQSSTMGGGQVGLGSLKVGSTGLIIGWLMGQVIALMVVLKVAWSNDRLVFKQCKRVKIIALARRYRYFPKVNLLSSVLNTASVQVPIILFSSFFSETVTGFFSLAQRILLIPMSLMGTAVGQVFLQRASELKKDKKRLKLLTLSIYKKLLIIGFFPTAVVLLFGNDLFAIVFSEKWRIAGEYAELLALWTFFVFISSPLSHLLTIYEKHAQALVFNVLLFSSRVCVLFFGWQYIQEPYQTVAVYGVVGAGVWFFFVLYLLSLADIGYIESIRPLFIALIAFLPVFIYKFY